MKLFALQSKEKKAEYFYGLGSFTRNRTLPFWSLCCFLLCNTKRSLCLELDDYFLEQKQIPCTKGAFSKSRYRVKWAFFRDWHLAGVELTYVQEGKNLAMWKGYYLKGVDGSTLYLFDDEQVIKSFGGVKNQYGIVPTARIGLETDLLNGYCTQAWIGSYSEGEAVFAHDFLDGKKVNDLSIYDRNFASFELIYKHIDKGSAFVMRVKTRFNQVVEKFVSKGCKQAIVEFNITQTALFMLKQQGYEVDKNTKVKVRLLRIEIGGDEPEILITSFLDWKKYPYSDFSELYWHRWGCETQIEVIKNKLQTEIFTGHKPDSIYQDFYTTMIVLNLYNLIVNSCNENLQQINEKRSSQMAINNNIAIGHLKTRILELFINKRPGCILRELQNLFLTHLEVIKPRRSFPRKPARKRQYGKYETYKNYRRAF